MLLLTACAPARIETIKPPLARTTPVAVPAIPDGRVACAHDPQKQCLDDAQTAWVLVSFADALDAANAKLRWLADYFGALPD
jgi:predicted carbohydrate-binding protein with CBM5 and CBM33 domain